MQLEYKFCGLRRTGEQIPGIVALVPQWFISAPLITLKLMGPRGLAVGGGGWHKDAPGENFRFYCVATEWYEVLGGKQTKREESFKTRKIIGDLQEPFLGQSDKKSDQKSDKKPSSA